MSATASRPVLRRLLDAQYRMYDRMRHKAAGRVAAEPGRTGPFDEIGDSGYLLLVTFKRDGSPVPTPVMFSQRDGKVYVRSEPGPKVKRARNNPHVRIARCNMRGKPKSPVYEATVRVLPPEEHQRAHDHLFDGYGAGIRVYESVADRMPVELAYLEISPVESQ